MELYRLAVAMIFLVLTACSKDESTCEPPMFSFGAALVDVRNSNFKETASLSFEVGSNSSVAELHNVKVTVTYPNELGVSTPIAYEQGKDDLVVTINKLVWSASYIAPNKERVVGLPVKVEKGVLSSPIVLRAQLDYRQLPGCSRGGTEDGTYSSTIELTTIDRKYLEWQRVDP